MYDITDLKNFVTIMHMERPPAPQNKKEMHTPKLEVRIRQQPGDADVQYFEIGTGDELFSRAILTTEREPFTYCCLDKLTTAPEHQDKGFARQIMEHIQSYLEATNTPGILCDIISEEGPAGMYERYGWKPLEGDPLTLGYNFDSIEQEKELVRFFKDNFQLQ